MPNRPRYLRFLLHTAVCLASVVTAFAQDPLRTLLVGEDRRQATSLNGDWHYIVDQPPARELYTEQGAIRDNGFAQNTHPNISSGPHNDEYDFATSPTLHVPGDWNTQDPALFRFEGVIWYERDFTFKVTPNTRNFLHVGAANYRSFVWVNGKRICDHEGGFTPFDCEVTSAIHDGSNFVVIAVDSTRHQDDIPSVSIDWWNYGGLTRDVSIVTLPQQFIDDYDVHLKHGTSFSASDAKTLSGYVHVVGASAGNAVTLRIPEAGVDASLKTDADGRANFELPARSLSLWSPESPKLYRVSLGAGSDQLTDEIGFRDVRVDGTKILLNGSAIFLQGANIHAEAPIRGGRANTDEDVKKLFGALHDLNANFARLAHYPHDERMERYADKYGVMLWSEIPLWQRITYSKPEVYQKAVTMLHEMIRRDRNKASVLFWSVSNETPNNPTRTKFLTDLANEARRTDPTRLITSAIISPKVDKDQILQDDPFIQALDVVGQNEYIGWYNGQPEDADRKTWTFNVQKPLIFSEFGSEARFGNHGGDHDRWTEEQQANVFVHQFEMMRKVPNLRGTALWVLIDFRSSTRNIPKLQDGYNRKGLFSEKLEKKKAFFVVQKAYQEHSIGKPE